MQAPIKDFKPNNTLMTYGWYVSNVSIIFDCSMLSYYHSWIFYNHFIVILYHFFVLTYWHSAQCQLLFFACFLHRTKSKTNGNETFWRFFWTRRHPVGQRSTRGPSCGEHKTPGLAWRPRRALVGSAHLRAPLWYFFGPPGVFWSRKNPQKFRYVWTPFGIDCLWSKKQAKTTTGTGHHVNRLVPKNDIKLL